MILSSSVLIVPVFLRLEKRGAQIILQKKIREDRTTNLYCELGWVSLFERRNFRKCLTVFKCLNGIYLPYLRRLFSYNSDVHHYNTRNRANLHMQPRVRSKVINGDDI